MALYWVYGNGMNETHTNGDTAMTQEQTKRTRAALSETLTLLETWTNRHTCDDHFEAEKQEKVAFYTSHAAKLQGMLDGSN